MTYREKGSVEIYEDYARDIVLRRPSAFGPWLVMGLGVILASFLSYLLYSNLTLSSSVAPSAERSLRTIPESTLPAAAAFSDQAKPLPLPPWDATMTSVPQSQATDALLGGDGPAALGLALSVPEMPADSPQTAAIPR